MISEIFSRTILFFVRVIQTCYATTQCGLSPFYFLPGGERWTSPYAAWKNFCLHARHLAAEVFELVSLFYVALRFVLPSDLTHRQECIAVFNGQREIEEIADWISGEKKAIEEVICSAREKKAVLFKIKDIVCDQWLQNAIDFDQIIWDFSKNRRLTRHSIDEFTMKLNEKLLALEETIPSDQMTSAISKKQKQLDILNRLTNKNKLTVSAYPDSRSLHIYEVSKEIDKTIKKLRLLYDPKSIIKEALDSLRKDYRKALSQAQNDLFAGKVSVIPGSGGLMLRIIETVIQHYAIPDKKMVEIDFYYSFKNITDLGEMVSKSDFVPNLMDQIKLCRKFLREACLAWSAKMGNFSMNRHKALRILELEDNATDAEIKKSAKKLILIHHPDKGGNVNVFHIIQNAYKCLIPH